jgi:hypothetical protein
MSFFNDFFTSPKEKAGREGFSQMQSEAAGLPQSFGNVNNLNDVYKNYGVKKFDMNAYRSQVGKTFDPAKRSLSTRRAQTLSRAADRMGGRSATPGMTFSGIETDFGNQANALEGQQAGANLEGFDKQTAQDMNIANLFKSLLDSKDSGAATKLGAKQSALRDYLSSLSGTSGFDDLMAGASTAASLATPMGLSGLFGRKAQRAFSGGK